MFFLCITSGVAMDLSSFLNVLYKQVSACTHPYRMRARAQEKLNMFQEVHFARNNQKQTRAMMSPASPHFLLPFGKEQISAINQKVCSSEIDSDSSPLVGCFKAQCIFSPCAKWMLGCMFRYLFPWIVGFRVLLSGLLVYLCPELLIFHHPEASKT